MHVQETNAPSRMRTRLAWSLGLVLAVLAMANGRCEPGGSGVVADVPAAWSTGASIWFFSGRAELDATERLKIGALAARSRVDPSLEFGIHRPIRVRASDSRPGSAPDRSSEPLATQRLAVIHDAMVAAGIPEDHIHVGDYGGPAYDVDRRTVVFVRTSQPAEEATRLRGDDVVVSAE